MLDRDGIIEAAVEGASIRANALRHSCSTTEVRQVLGEFAEELLAPSARAQMLALEVARLDMLEAVFLRRALETLDPACGTLVTKISQRRAALCGLDQPATLRLDLAAVPEHDDGKTSTTRMLEAIRRLRGENDKPEDGEDPTKLN